MRFSRRLAPGLSCAAPASPGDAAPVKVFERHERLSACQIINYQASPDGEWLLLMGIKRGVGEAVDGEMQLYSVQRGVSQCLQGHAGCFLNAKVREGGARAQLLAFAEKKPDTPARLFVMEVAKERGGDAFKLAPQSIPYPADAPNDFPVSMVGSEKHDMLYMFTKGGLAFVFDVHTGSALFRNRASQTTVFVTCPNSRTGGVLGVTVQTGKVLHLTLNEAELVPFVMHKLGNQGLALGLARRLGLAGAEDLYVSQFNSLLAANDVAGAARLAATSPRGFLRTRETIARFAALPQEPGQPMPLMRYFSVVLEHGKLNALESVEVAKPVLQQNGTQLLTKWLQEDKLECTEELGDLVAQYDQTVAQAVFVRAQAHAKVVDMFMRTGAYGKIVAYAKQTGYKPDYMSVLNALVRSNPKGAEDFAKQLAAAGSETGAQLIDVAQAVEVFRQYGRIAEATSFLLEVLREDRPEDGFLQTRVLEINLLGGAAQVAEGILSAGMFTHFDRQKVAQLCERAQLYQRALQLYTALDDIKRVLVHAPGIPPEFMEEFLGRLPEADELECLSTLLRTNPRVSLRVVVSAGTKHVARLGLPPLIALFEEHNSVEGLYYFLGGVLNSTEDPDAHYKFIAAALKLGQLREVERVCRDRPFYDPKAVKDLLLEARLKDPRPLIHVCDKFDFVEELTAYLANNNMLKFVEVYVTKVSPGKTAQVVGKLLDLDCNEDFIKSLLIAVGPACPVDSLVEEVEKRNRLRFLQPWLEARIAEGNTEPATHNAIGKIYITLNREPQQFLLNNQFYDSKVVGKFCEKLDPYLAYLAYRRAWGACDEELMAVTTSNGLFKDQARYLVERQDADLWAVALQPDNPHRGELVEQVVSTALPESKDPEEVSTSVRAFIQADLPHELIGLLERLVLQGSDFARNKSLQNLLILTAIKAAKERVMDYINRLDNFDGPQIAKIAVGEQYQLYEEAFTIYRKFQLNVDAVDVLIDNLEDLERAHEFAERCDEADVWSRLAAAQLHSGQVPDAIAAYIKARDASNFSEVIDAAGQEGAYAELVRYLHMAREQVKEPKVDSELIFSLAKTGQLGQLEEFVASPNVAHIQALGDRCFAESMFEAAKLLFANINNNAKLASCYVHLGQFREAVEAARKANSVRTWKEVNAACVEAGEFRLAQVCGLHIIVSPDHLEELLYHYERHGHTDELISLMEQGLGQEGAHTGIFTELGVLYSKYRPDRLMEHIKLYWSRMHAPKMLRACEAGRHWAAATFLYVETKDFDMAVRTMVEHSPSAFDHERFMSAIQQVRNQELHYVAIKFYLEEHPMLLGKLLTVLTPKLDHARVVHQVRKTDNLPLVLPYLRAVQAENISAVNEAVNEIYVDEENYDELRASIAEHDNFDQLGLAQQLEKHELLEFRRIAAELYKRNRNFEKSVELSKKDQVFRDAIDTVAESRDAKLAESLLRFFLDGLDEPDKECFAAALYTCYDLVRPDVALELAWRHRLIDFAMPYLVQYIRDVDGKVRTHALSHARTHARAAAPQLMRCVFPPRSSARSTSAPSPLRRRWRTRPLRLPRRPWRMASSPTACWPLVSGPACACEAPACSCSAAAAGAYNHDTGAYAPYAGYDPNMGAPGMGMGGDMSMHGAPGMGMGMGGAPGMGMGMHSQGW